MQLQTERDPKSCADKPSNTTVVPCSSSIQGGSKFRVQLKQRFKINVRNRSTFRFVLA